MTDILSPARPYENGFYELVKDAWKLDLEEEKRSMEKLIKDKWTVTELAKSYIAMRFESIEAEECMQTETPSLSDLVADRIYQEVMTSSDREEQIRMIAQELEWPILRRLLTAGRLPYLLTRKLYAQCLKSSKGDLDLSLDMDLILMNHSAYVCSQIGKGKDLSRYTLGLQDLFELADISVADDSESITMRRPRRPPFSVELFQEDCDQCKVCATDEIFKQHLEKVTGSLDHMDWSGVIITGSAVVAALKQQVTPWIHQRQYYLRDLVADVSIYGMSAKDASQKIQDILSALLSDQHDTSTYSDVRKTVDYTTFHTDSGIVRIKHTTYTSMIDAMESSPVDSCGIAWTGTKLLFSARAARAFETGRNTFKIGMAHRSSNRDSCNAMKEIFESAAYGIRLMIPPLFVKSLADEHFPQDRTRYIAEYQLFARSQIASYNRIDGYKTDDSQSVIEDDDDSDDDTDHTQLGLERGFSRYHEGSGSVRAAEMFALCSSSFQRLVWANEIFQKLKKDHLIESHHHGPSFLGTSDLFFSNFLRPGVELRLGQWPVPRAAYNGYLTRRIRCPEISVQIGSDSFHESLRKPIVAVVVIPKALEAYLDNEWERLVPTRSAHEGVLLPICKASTTHNGWLPALQDNDTEAGNLRYLVLGSRRILKGVDARIDVLADVLRLLADYTTETVVDAYEQARDGSDQSQQAILGAATYSITERLKTKMLSEFRYQSSAYRPACSDGGFGPRDAEILKAWLVADPLSKHWAVLNAEERQEAKDFFPRVKSVREIIKEMRANSSGTPVVSG